MHPISYANIVILASSAHLRVSRSSGALLMAAWCQNGLRVVIAAVVGHLDCDACRRLRDIHGDDADSVILRYRRYDAMHAMAGRLVELAAADHTPATEAQELRAMAERLAALATALRRPTIAITGVLPTMTRTQAAALIQAAGGTVVPTVSKGTDYLLAGEQAGSRLTQAQALGVTVIDEADLQAMLA